MRPKARDRGVTMRSAVASARDVAGDGGDFPPSSRMDRTRNLFQPLGAPRDRRSRQTRRARHRGERRADARACAGYDDRALLRHSARSTRDIRARCLRKACVMLRLVGDRRRRQRSRRAARAQTRESVARPVCRCRRRARCRSAARAARDRTAASREREIVIGPAPPKRAERAARVEPVERASYAYVRHLVFVRDRQTPPTRVAARRTLRVAELAEEHAFAAERLLSCTEKRHDVGVEPVRARRRCRPNSRASSRMSTARAMLEGRMLRSRVEVFAVHAAGDAGARAFEQRFGQARAPLRGILRASAARADWRTRCRDPRRQRGMLAHALADARARRAPALEQRGIGVEIADQPYGDVVSCADACESGRAACCGSSVQAGQPVHAAHVPAEERRHRAQPGVGDAFASPRRSGAAHRRPCASGSGWNASQRRKKRTTSRPSALMRAMSSRISPRSKRCHMYIALRRGQ